MADVFGRNIKWAGGFLPENTRVSFSGVSTQAIVRNISIEYQQPVSTLWDLNGRAFMVAGTPQGAWGIGTVAGGSAISAVAGWSVCNPGNVSISGNSGLCSINGNDISGGSGSYSLSLCVTTQLRVSMTAEDMIINEGLGGTFLALNS